MYRSLHIVNYTSPSNSNPESTRLQNTRREKKTDRPPFPNEPRAMNLAFLDSDTFACIWYNPVR